MVASAGEQKHESFFLKSPRELLLLFGGGEVTTSKPKPDPIPEIPKETVPLAVKSASQANSVVTNHPSLLEKLNPLSGSFFLFGGASHDPSKDPNLVLLKARVTIVRANVAGIDVVTPFRISWNLAKSSSTITSPFSSSATKLIPVSFATGLILFIIVTGYLNLRLSVQMAKFQEIGSFPRARLEPQS